MNNVQEVLEAQVCYDAKMLRVYERALLIAAQDIHDASERWERYGSWMSRAKGELAHEVVEDGNV